MQPDILLYIINKLAYKYVFKLERLSKEYQKIIKSKKLFNKIFINCRDKVLYLLNNYNFQVFHLHVCGLFNADLKLFVDKHTVVLYMCPYITDAGIQYLANCKIVDVSYNKQLTDTGIIHLEKCEYLNVQGCDISNELIEKLRKTVKYLVRKSSV